MLKPQQYPGLAAQRKTCIAESVFGLFQGKDSGGAGAETPTAGLPVSGDKKERELFCPLKFGWHHEAQKRSRPNEWDEGIFVF